jgi:hypothetical protein
VRVSKDGAAPWFETRSFGALLTMRPIECFGVWSDNYPRISAVTCAATERDMPCRS